jgi:hypothetical protein
MQDMQKNLWAPIRRGLVVDPAGKHVNYLRLALALHLYLILHADWQTGVVIRKLRTIARDMGTPVRTIGAWMQRLRRGGYVTVKRTGHALVIRVQNWRSPWQEPADQSGRTLPIRSAGSCRTFAAKQRNGRMNSSQSAARRPLNDIRSTKSLIQRRSTDKDTAAATPNGDRHESLMRQELLAVNLADGLGDRANLPHYVRYARRYPEALLRRLLGEARAVPASAIKRSRAALFESLLKRHVHAQLEDPRD